MNKRFAELPILTLGKVQRLLGTHLSKQKNVQHPLQGVPTSIWVADGNGVAVTADEAPFEMRIQFSAKRPSKSERI